MILILEFLTMVQRTLVCLILAGVLFFGYNFYLAQVELAYLMAPLWDELYEAMP